MILAGQQYGGYLWHPGPQEPNHLEALLNADLLAAFPALDRVPSNTSYAFNFPGANQLYCSWWRMVT